MAGRKNTAQHSDLDKYLNWIKTVKNASRKAVVVAQTKGDRDGLRMLGVKNVIYPFQPFEDFVDMVWLMKKPVILLYNVDRSSNAKHERLRALLQQRKVSVNSRFRKLLYGQKNQTVRGIIKLLHKMAGGERIHKGLPV